MSREYRELLLQGFAAEGEPLEGKGGGGLLRGGSRGAFRKLGRLGKANLSAYASGGAGHAGVQKRRKRIQLAQRYLIGRADRPGNRWLGRNASRYIV